MNTYILENKDNQYKNETYDPILEYDTVAPDDFVHAPAPDLYFKYSITDPITGEPLIDSETNLASTDFIAYSVEYEGEYCWTYNVYREEVEGLTTDYPELVNTWAPANAQNQFPQSYEQTWDFWVESYERDLDNGDLRFTCDIQTTYPTVRMNYDFDTGEYVVEEKPPFNVALSENIELYINDKYYGEVAPRMSNMFYTFNSDTFTFDYNERMKEPFEFTFTLDEDELGDEDIELQINSIKYLDDDISQSGDYNISRATDQTEQVVLSTDQTTMYNLQFENENSSKEVSIPYSWYLGQPIKYETFTFEKLFTNKYEYPTTTTDLLKVSYDNEVTNTFPQTDTEFIATVDIEGYPQTDFKVKKRFEGNDAILYIDEQMYYDYDEQQVKVGTSGGKYIDETGLILPWDDIVSGTITFTMVVHSYQDYTFNFNLQIGNSKKLRGDDGKYEVREVTNED